MGVQATMYKSFVARASHLAVGQPDGQCACKGSSSATSKPTNQDWEGLKRPGVYLELKPRVVHKCAGARCAAVLTAFADANWADDRGGAHPEDVCSFGSIGPGHGVRRKQ